MFQPVRSGTSSTAGSAPVFAPVTGHVDLAEDADVLLARSAPRAGGGSLPHRRHQVAEELDGDERRDADLEHHPLALAHHEPGVLEVLELWGRRFHVFGQRIAVPPAPSCSSPAGSAGTRLRMTPTRLPPLLRRASRRAAASWVCCVRSQATTSSTPSTMRLRTSTSGPDAVGAPSSRTKSKRLPRALDSARRRSASLPHRAAPCSRVPWGARRAAGAAYPAPAGPRGARPSRAGRSGRGAPPRRACGRASAAASGRPQAAPACPLVASIAAKLRAIVVLPSDSIALVKRKVFSSASAASRKIVFEDVRAGARGFARLLVKGHDSLPGQLGPLLAKRISSTRVV